MLLARRTFFGGLSGPFFLRRLSLAAMSLSDIRNQLDQSEPLDLARAIETLRANAGSFNLRLCKPDGLVLLKEIDAQVE